MTERDWEAASVRRLENLVADTVNRMRDMADQIERDTKRNLVSAKETERSLEFHTYPRVAGQVIHDLQTLLFNVKLDSLVEAANDAETARTEKRLADRGGTLGKAGERGAHRALVKLLGVLDGWIEGARANHDGFGHSTESWGEECWRQFAPSDIRRMVNDAAREVGLSVEFADPEVATEDRVR